MLLALVILLFPAPQGRSVTADSVSSKPIISAAVRPILLAKDMSRTPKSTENSAGVPNIPAGNSFPADVPAIASMHLDPAPPVNYLPDSPIPHVAASSSNLNTFEAPIKPAGRTSHPQMINNRGMWYGLLATSHAAAIMDAYSTRRVISRDLGSERNPLLRPFANSNSLYVAVQASPLLMDFLGRKMMRSENSWVRHMWWVPQTAGTVASILSSVHNLRISQ